MDAKTASVAYDDSLRAAHSKDHSYEHVFTTFATPPQQPPFVQSISLNQDEPPPKNEVNDDDKAKMSPQQKTGNSRSPLFWVNSDPQTVQKGSREETLKRIRSHVMSEHNRKKRLENTRRYNKSKTWKNLAYRPESMAASKFSRAIESSIPSPSSSSTSDRSSSKSSSSPEIRETSPPDSFKIPKSTGSMASETLISLLAPQDSTQDWTQESPQDQQISVIRKHETSSVPAAPYVGTDDVLDPFQATQIRLSSAQYQHLKFFLYDLVPQAAPFMNHGVAKLRKHWISLAQSSPSVLYACITSAVTNKSLMTGDFFADPATQRNSLLILDRLRNRGETISLINRDLSSVPSATSDACISAVSLLISVEVTGSNPQDIAPHLHGLRKMVSLRKNFADINKSVRSQVEWNDIRSACKTMTKPFFPFIRYTMPSHTPPEVSVKNAGKLASALRLLDQIPGVFGVEMCRTIDDLTSLTLYAEIFKLQPKLAAILFDEEIEEYFNNEVLYTEYCLVNDRWITTPPSSAPNINASPDTPIHRLRGDDTIEGAVRLASLLFHNTTIWPFYPAIAPLFPLPIFCLETALRNGIAAGTYTFLPDLLIWLLFIGATAGKYLPTARAWFMDELAKAVDAYNSTNINEFYINNNNNNEYKTTSPPQLLTTVDNFRDLLAGYFYVDRCYMADVSEIWMTLMARR
ncbi:hypothetical protein EYB25_006793 [Talaromyces marneffei]|uniref:uncharacterized protein n=1 Tax=Talaromyces marneffei TaxID=37727 RepID=UPI0012A8E54E|nr:uncharacterized protein EYB26_007936 [Talaromyces marneffei]KAE8550565.1 hypothetical protein EYB25_006793 [Talaromyces marneffei]QGA20234.1 hypothetical protein EYB26_007936 [Talaromyces marneffei]